MDQGPTVVDFWAGALGRAFSSWVSSLQDLEGMLSVLALLLLVFSASKYYEDAWALMNKSVERRGRKWPALMVALWFGWFVVVQVGDDFAMAERSADVERQLVQGRATEEIARIQERAEQLGEVKDERIEFLRDQLREGNQDINVLEGREAGYKRDLAQADAGLLEARRERDEAQEITDSLRRIQWYSFKGAGPSDAPNALEVFMVAHGVTAQPFAANLRFSAPVTGTSYQIKDQYVGMWHVVLDIDPQDPRTVQVRAYEPAFSPQFPLRIVVFSTEAIHLEGVDRVEARPRQ